MTYNWLAHGLYRWLYCLDKLSDKEPVEASW